MTPEEREKRLLALQKQRATSAEHENQNRPQSSTTESSAAKRKSQSSRNNVKRVKTDNIVTLMFDSTADARSVVSSDEQQSRQLKSIVPQHEVINLDSDEDNVLQQTVPRNLKLTESSVRDEVNNALRYSKGKVLLTSAKGYTVQSNHVSIESLFDRANLRRAVLAAFQIDLEWTLSKLNIGRTAIHIACEAKSEDTKQQWQQIAKQVPKLNVIFPPMNHANCMHSKLQLLFFDDFLRFVTPSANLMPYDWGETGVMENVMYVQDFPLRKPAAESDDTDDESEFDDSGTCTFLADLTYFLKRSNYPELIITDLQKYSFRAASHVRFVASVGGENYAPHDLQKSGLPRLSSAIQSLGVSLSDIQVEYITASIGALNQAFVTSFVSACRGRAPFDVKAMEEYSCLMQQLRIYFPTREAVLNSRAGHAGTICFQSSYYSKSQFPKDSLMTHVAVRKGLLSHCKMILCRPTLDETQGWAYVGSANFSASAWGDRIVKDRVTKRNRMNCRNWECGVVVPISLAEEAIPVQRSATKNTNPWYFLEQ